MIDLHLHTNMSDGSDTPLELLEKVEELGLSIFSVTDHDDIRANRIIIEQMKKRPYDVKFITGVEISAVFNNKNMHMLCYGFDPYDKGMAEMIAEGAKLRRLRIAAMIDYLKEKFNIEIPEAEKREILRREIPGKVHVSDAIMKMRSDLTRNDVFKNFLNGMESRHFNIPAETVIKTVHNAGGQISLAHPIEIQKEYSLTDNELSGFAQELQFAGLDAIEVYHSSHDENKIELLKAIAFDTCLKVSRGSDYHGKNKNVKIGELPKGQSVTQNDVTVLNGFFSERFGNLSGKSLYEKAFIIAKIAHEGQKDWQGVEYIKHPIAVSSFCKTEHGKIAALLHDVIEDSDIESGDLIEIGFPDDIIKAVIHLTKSEDWFGYGGRDCADFSEYKESATERYLLRVSESELAAEVKFADIRHNSDKSRFPSCQQEEAKKNCKKYIKRAFLLMAMVGHDYARKNLMTKETYNWFLQNATKDEMQGK